MDYIKLALEKAQVSKAKKPRAKPVIGASKSVKSPKRTVNVPSDASAIKPTDIFSTSIDPHFSENLLEHNRIVSIDMKDPSYIAFNILRTKIFSVMQDREWKSLAITSPGPGCGKTTIAINLALSLARQETCRTVLVDLDLSRPTIASKFGIRVQNSLSGYLTGETELGDCFIKVRDNLVMALNNDPLPNSSEITLHQRTRTLREEITELLNPDIIIFDLPPLLVGDDAIGFIPYVDCSMMVLAEGKTSFKEMDQSDQKLGNIDNFLGHVLNMSFDKSETIQYYA